MEKERVQQLLAFAEQKNLTEKQKRAVEIAKQKATQNRLLAEKRKIENEKKQKELEASQKDRLLKEQQLEQSAAYRLYSIIFGILAIIIVATVLIAFILNRKKNKDLKKANLSIVEKNEELLTSEEELRQNMEELETTQEAMKQSQKEVQRKNKKLESQQKVLEKTYYNLKHKNKALTDSIVYAERIQQAILPSSQELTHSFDDFFVFFKPKDIVSGDFYWYNQIEDKTYVAVIDCTGHGVPGAFMSLVGNSLLNEIINKDRVFDTNKILEQLHIKIRESLKQDETSNTDGMDLMICRFQNNEDHTIQLQVSGAKSFLYYYNQQSFQRIKGDRLSIGGIQSESKRKFSKQELNLSGGDTIFLTSDGILDMPNPKRKSFGTKNLLGVLKEHVDLPFEEQREKLEEALLNHSQGTNQRDDITLLGLKLRGQMPKLNKATNIAIQNPGDIQFVEFKPIMNSATDQNLDLLKNYPEIQPSQITLSHRGVLTDTKLTDYSRDLRSKVFKNPKMGKKIFAIFMEVAQNVLFYSKEISTEDENHKIGSLNVLDLDQYIMIITGNMVYTDSVESLQEKCDTVNSLDREGLREYKRSLRNAPRTGESKGAGIGMVQAALTSDNPLAYEFIQAEDEKYTFFILSVRVEKQSKLVAA